jgi:6-phosphogluconolactonase (cycloisomerase 2 family)
VPNQNSGTISGYTIDSSTGALTQVAGSPFTDGFSASTPNRAAVTPDHRFLYISNGDATVFGYKINPNGTLTSIFSPIAAADASGIAVDSSGNYLYVALKHPGAIDGEVAGFGINQTTGGLTALAGSPFSLGAGNRGAQGIAATGNFLYVVLGVNNSVELMTITPATGVLAAGASTSLPFSDIIPGPLNVTAPFDIRIDGANHLYVSDAGYFAGPGATAGLAAFTINPGGGLSPTSTPTYATGANPFGIGIDPTGRFLYTANNTSDGAGSVSAFTIAGNGNLAAIAGSPFSTGVGNGPAGVAADPSGNFLYVTNDASNTVSGFRIAQSGTLGSLSFISATGTGLRPFLLASTTAPAAAPPPSSVPAASTWSLAVLGVLLAGFSALLYRKAYR